MSKFENKIFDLSAGLDSPHWLQPTIGRLCSSYFYHITIVHSYKKLTIENRKRNSEIKLYSSVVQSVVQLYIRRWQCGNSVYHFIQV
jgi:hypothetical protein